MLGYTWKEKWGLLAPFRAKSSFPYSVSWVWRKLSSVHRRQNSREERTPEFQVSEKKRGFKPSKMTDHKIEQRKER